MKKKFILILFVLFSLQSLQSQIQKPGFYVNGRFLYTPCDDKVILRGINKMVIYDSDLERRKNSYKEIRKTGANCVRIVWTADPGQSEDATPDALDRNIQECIDNQMIPMVELHDATGDISLVPALVNFWIRPDVVSIIKKHEKYLLLNIANEPGNETVTSDEFKNTYKNAISKLRGAGITVPLVIDASTWGQNIDILLGNGKELIDNDPLHNILFSVHTYWDKNGGQDAQYIGQKLQQCVNADLPLIIGEFTYKFTKGADCDYETDYKAIIKNCQEKEIGWLVWEWGPGNEYFYASCAVMNMTDDSKFNTLKDGWAKEVAMGSPYSINKTAVTSKYILNGGKCDPSNNVEINTESGISFTVYPNPVTSNSVIMIKLNQGGNVSLKLFNSIGLCINNIAESYLTPGDYTFRIKQELNNIPSGIYYCVLRYGNQVFISQIAIIN
jgi:mannan endo-1,4-beta-mannosidase